MFVSKTHLPQLLAPDTYHSSEHYELELSRLFAHGWHVVGSTADIPKAGDYATVQLGPYPIIVRNFGAETQAFLNVCCHRFCEIAPGKSGHSEQFKCQYHGWEYDAAGNTRRIPDAPSFKPLEHGQFGLTRYRTALCGQLIFISLAEVGPSLEEFLGPSYETYQKLFSPPYQQILAVDVECEANWKLAVENGLESYHVDCVHTSTFGKTPPAEDCCHELEPGYTIFETPSSEPGSFGYRLEKMVARGRQQTPTHTYMNLRTYPSLTCSQTDTISFVQSILPLGPTRCLCVHRLFMPRPSDWLARLAIRCCRRFVTKYWRAVFMEDQSILPRIQKGMQAPCVPKGGLISAREERLFHFQEYVIRACGLA